MTGATDWSAVRLQLERMSITLDTLYRLAFTHQLCTECDGILVASRDLLSFSVASTFVNVIVTVSWACCRIAGRALVMRRACSALIPCELRRALHPFY